MGSRAVVTAVCGACLEMDVENPGRSASVALPVAWTLSATHVVSYGVPRREADVDQ